MVTAYQAYIVVQKSEYLTLCFGGKKFQVVPGKFLLCYIHYGKISLVQIS